MLGSTKKSDESFFIKNTVQKLNISDRLTRELSKICLWNIKKNSDLGLKSNNLYCLFDIPKDIKKIIQMLILPKGLCSKIITFINLIYRKLYKFYILNKLNKELGIFNLINSYFKSNNASIVKVDLDCYLNKPSNSAVIDWHRDGALSSTLKNNEKKFKSVSVKIFIFLDAYINSKNRLPCLQKEEYPYLAVISNSCKPIKIIDNLLMKNKIKSIGSNHNSHEILGLINSIIRNNALKINKNEEQSLISLKNNIEEIHLADNIKHNNYGVPSTVVLFDDKNLHKGSNINQFDRLVLRLMFRGTVK